MLTRIISGLLGIPLLVIVLYKGGILLYGATMIVALIGLYEFYHAMKNKNFNPISFLGYGLTIIILSGFYFSFNNAFLLTSIIVTVITISTMQLFSSKYTIVDSCITLYGLLYVALLLGHIILTERLENKGIIWLIFIIAWSTDTFAYFGGYFFGKKKLCPKISPKKTVEGAVIGILGCMLTCGIFAHVFFIEYKGAIILLGMFGSIFSQIGDLTASQIKRHVGIKDFGNLIPGHGGVLDRFDSILFTAPIVYHFFTIFMKYFLR